MFNLKTKNITDIPGLEQIDQNIIADSELTLDRTIPKNTKLSALGNTIGNNLKVSFGETLKNTIINLNPLKSKLEREIIREAKLL